MSGVVDLSALAGAREAAAKAQQSQNSNSTSTQSNLVVEVTLENFENVAVAQSHTVPVLINFYSGRSPASLTLRHTLEQVVNAGDGVLLLANVDVDAHMQIAQAFQIQSLPSVFALIGGRPLPLPFTGTDTNEHLSSVIEAVLQQAASMGVTGRLAVSESAPATVEPVSDPRFDAAESAIDRGDWEAAKSAYQQVLADTPADPIARIGLLNVELMQRTDGIDFESVIAQAPTLSQNSTIEEINRHLLAADAEFIMNEPEIAFKRLLELVRDYPGQIRDAARARLLDLFAIAGPDDPAVKKSRVDLANALF